jgi:hypothetical protein
MNELNDVIRSERLNILVRRHSNVCNRTQKYRDDLRKKQNNSTDITIQEWIKYAGLMEELHEALLDAHIALIERYDEHINLLQRGA